MKKRLLVAGYGGHGKDKVCEIIKSLYGYSFISSSRYALDEFIYDRLQPEFGYEDKEQCYTDRRNHRVLWFTLIQDYCTPDLTRLGRNLFKDYDIYCGARNREEFLALKENSLFDYSIWVDASKRLPKESSGSNTILPSDCDFILDNNDTLVHLVGRIKLLMEDLIQKS